MSADGEIEVAVRAEGADDAADKLAEGVEAPEDGAAGGGIGSALKRGGIVGAIAALARPLLELLQPLVDIAKAFLAPMAVMLLRLFSPVLRGLIRLLPRWINFIDTVTPVLLKARDLLLSLPGRLWSFVSALPGMIWSAFSSGASWLANGAQAIGQAVWSFVSSLPSRIWSFVRQLAPDIWSFMKGLPADIWSFVQQLPRQIWSFVRQLPRQIWSFFKQLPNEIGQAVAAELPSVPSRQGVTDTVTDTAGDARGFIRNNTPQINIGGGLAPLIDEIESSDDVDLIP